MIGAGPPPSPAGPVRLGVITVVRNAAEALEATLRSVQEQRHADLRHVVVDGGSTDGTREVLLGYAGQLAAWRSERDAGIYDAMNKGISLLPPDVDYVNFLNAGDRFHDADTVAACLGSRRLGEDELVYGDVLVESPAGDAVRVPAGSLSRESLLRRSTAVVCHQAIFVSCRVLRPYDTRYQLKAELDWYFAMLDATPSPRLRYVPRVVVRYPTGGVSERLFLRDRVEGLEVVWRRYGLRPFLRYPVLPRFLLELARFYRLKPRLRALLRRP